MEKHIIISSVNNLAAILHEGYLYEFIMNNPLHQLGNIYIGKVARVFPTIKAIFVTIQINRKYKNGFIHNNDLSGIKNRRDASLPNIVVLKQKLCVQIIKEAFFGKNPRLTVNISIPGRYVIFSPINKIVCISRKISRVAEKEYLKSLALLLYPLSSGGIFFKYHSSQVSSYLIIEEWKTLKFRWAIILKIINQKTHLHSFLLYQDSDILKKVIRDFYHIQVHSIWVDIPLNIKKLRFYLKHWHCFILNPNLNISLISNHLFNNFRLYSAIAQASTSRVELLPAGYIFIENFEALTVIDVNSGIFDKYKYPSSVVLTLNCYAAKEIAYQIKTRNISGIIVIDFIDMRSRKDQLELLRYLQKLFRLDLIPTQVVQFSELGLVEVTRKRSGKNISELLNNYQMYFSLAKTFSYFCSSIKDISSSCSSSSYLFSRLSLSSMNISLNYFKEIKKSNLFLTKKRIQYSKKIYILNFFLQQTRIYIE
uniref:ribonuclease E n=1 Tax=Rhodospora sordida TaxID=362230 RepID=UPI001FCDF657|nr:ribonuclease E [Rhodospora sordida]UNJ15072.1 ribonuclease E [Rhodospora sordida]